MATIDSGERKQIECPACGAQADLARVFDEAQAKWRPVLGLTPVWDVDIRDVDMK